jgi:LssY C-terminus
VTVWLIAFVLFDFADQRLPVAVAVAVTYGLAAYVVLPRAIRIGLRILQRGRVPSYTITGDGLPGDPVNLVLIGTTRQLRSAFAAAGWSEADALGLASSWRMVRAFVLDEPYPKAPFSTLYLFGRGQDFGFQQPIGDSPRKRHHVRFWGLSFERAEQTLDTPSFWLDTLRPPDHERVLWIGAATKDTGFSLTRLSFQITHATDADTNEERDFIIGELQDRGVVANVRSHRPSERLSIGQVNRYLTDGFVAVAELSPPAG